MCHDTTPILISELTETDIVRVDPQNIKVNKTNYRGLRLSFTEMSLM